MRFQIQWLKEGSTDLANSGSVYLSEGEAVTIGRKTDVDIRLMDKKVSRQHATVYINNGRVVIKDVGSINGTFIDGKRIVESRWLPEQSVRIGPCRLSLIATSEDINRLRKDDYPDFRSTIAEALDRNHHNEALVRKARLARWASLILFIIFIIFSLLSGTASYMIPSVKDAEYARLEQNPKVLRARALEEIGKNLFDLTIAAVALGCLVLSAIFARKWARIASESIASSEVINRRALRAARSKGVPFALYLRGFVEEGESFRFVFFTSFSQRPDNATRWIESDIVAELDRRNRNVFCIANPSDKFMLPGAIRLPANPADWLSDVVTLVEESEIIVVYLPQFQMVF